MKSNTELYTIIGQKHAELAELYAQLGTADEAVSSTPAKAANKKATKTVAEAPVVEEDAEEDGEEVEFTKEGLNELSLAELKEIADDNDIEYTKSVKKQPLIKIILEAMEDAEEEDADAEEEAAEEADVEVEEVEDEEERDTVLETEDGEIDLATMTFGKLKALAKEYEIEITAKNKDGAIDQILAGLSEEDEEEDAEDEDSEEVIDLDAMDLSELKSLAEEEGIELPAKKKTQKAAAYTQAVRDILEEALAGEADEEEDEDEDGEIDIAEEYGLNDMDTEELAEILESYEMSPKGKKQALIARIVKGVEDGEIEFEEEEGE